MTVTALAPTSLASSAIARPASIPRLIVVLVSLRGGLPSCELVIRRLTSDGAVVFAQEVDSIATRLDADCAALERRGLDD